LRRSPSRLRSVCYSDGSQTRPRPWNKGKLVGAKAAAATEPRLSIRTKLQIEGKKRDLALFNLAVDSKLPGCEFAVRVEDLAPSGYSMDRATIRQKKTGRPVRFELTDQTRMAIDDYLRLTGRKPGQFLFAGRGGHVNTRVSCRNGWPASASILRSSARTRCAERSNSWRSDLT